MAEPPRSDRAFDPRTPRAFAVAVFISAFLLFSVQLIAARHLLPLLGGVPAVWSTCLLFFQALLFGGYAYAHALTQRSASFQTRFHFALLVLSAVLLGLRAAEGGSPLAPWPASHLLAAAFDDSPALQAFATLAATVGLPFFALSATGPLLQAWHAQVRPRGFPYRLYALSNLGSLLALAAYPLLVEPALTLSAQGFAWTLSFVGLGVAIAWAARELSAVQGLESPDRSTGQEELSPPRISAATFTFWCALAAIPSALLAATTQQICLEVAAVPLLWALPLALYLATFVVCFSARRPAPRLSWLLRFTGSASAAAIALAKGAELDFGLQILAFSLALVAGSMICHGELARSRPEPASLTTFYLAVALGGALGAAFVAVLAPALFPEIWELPLLLGAIVPLVAGAWWRDLQSPLREDHPRGELPAALAFGAAAFGAALLAFGAREGGRFDLPYALAAGIAAALVTVSIGRKAPTRFAVGTALAGSAIALAVTFIVARGDAFSSNHEAERIVFRDRNFFGVIRVAEKDHPTFGRSRALLHGRTNHGEQYLGRSLRRLPVAYYGTSSGIGRAFAALREHRKRPLAIGVVGLGAGALATQSRTGDSLRFYEINPTVVDLATGSHARFTYLAEAAAPSTIVLGDGRIALERERARGELGRFDLLAIDAFSSDAVPVHLLTREAVALDLAHLAPDGVLAFNLSNRFVDLRPVVRALAADAGLGLRIVEQHERRGIEWPSSWALLTRDLAIFEHDAVIGVEADRGAFDPSYLWTDDRSALLPVIRW